MSDYGRALTADELRGVATIIESLEDATSMGDVGVDFRAIVMDSNGEHVGVISNHEGFVFYYPAAELIYEPGV